MHLKKLSCLGFKSFADLTEFHFHPGITAIVGPNGCGKSNVVDAFRWVLGERSAKGLRGKEMLDVIFKGTRNRDPLSRAEVTLVFDNEDGTLPLDHAEVEVTRRLYRSGDSEYLLNRKKCRLKDILATFEATGIGTDGYSVLEQGAVDAFLHSNPAERRAIFEEAAGVSKFKKDRRRTLSQLDRVETNLARTGDILTEVERRVRSVKIQASKAKRFLEDKERFTRLRAVVAVEELRRFRREREHVSYRLVELQSRRQIIADIGNGLESQRLDLRGELDGMSQRIADLSEREMVARMAIERIEQRRHHVTERRDEMDEAAAQRAAQRGEIEQVIAGYRAERASLRARLLEEVAALRASRAELTRAEHGLRSAQQQKIELADRLKETKEAALQHVFAQTRLSNQKATLESEERSIAARRQRRLEESQGFERERVEIEAQREALDSKFVAIESAAREAREAGAILVDEIDRRTGLLSENQLEHEQLRERVEAMRARARVLGELERSHEGVSVGAQALLGTQHIIRRDVIGLLAEAIDAEPDVAPLVDAALGHDGESVVLWGDTPMADRARAVGRLLSGQAATVCHVGGVYGREDANGNGYAASPHPRLIDRLHYPELHRPLIERMLGDVLCVDDLDTAVRVARTTRRRVVLPDARIVEPWGAVTFPPAEGGGLVSRRAELSHLHDALRGQEGVLSDLREQGATLELAIDARRNELRRVEEELQRCQLGIENLQRHREEFDQDIARLRERSEVVAHEIAEIDRASTMNREQLDGVNRDLTAIGAKREESDARVITLETELHAIDSQLSDIMHEVSAARVTATQNEERIVSSRRAERQHIGEISERQDRLRFLADDDRKDVERGEQYDREEREHQREESERGSELAQLEEQHAALDGEAKQLRVALAECESRAAQARDEEERLRTQREADLIRDNEIRVRMQTLREAVADDLEIDFMEAPVDEWGDELRAEEESDESFWPRVRDELESVQVRLRKNANVNLEAVQELEELEERFETLSDQIEDLTNSRDNLVEVIEELNIKCRDLFVETFEVVRRHFQELFVKIFGGGRADLSLEEGYDVLEAGIQVSACPPGKRINSLQLMSGGEKALTAVAVLFALFKARPSPFCLLDEVDAPLDEANNRRYVKILQEFSGLAQFLVITHSKVTMAEAETLYGVTMQEEGVSKQLAVRLEEVDELSDEKHRRGAPSRLGDADYGSIRHPLAVGSEPNGSKSSEPTIRLHPESTGAELS